MKSMIKAYLCLAILLLLQLDPGEGRGGRGGGGAGGGWKGGTGRSVLIVFSIIGGVIFVPVACSCFCAFISYEMERRSESRSVHTTSRKESPSDDLKLEEVTTDVSTKHAGHERIEDPCSVSADIIEITTYDVESETEPMLCRADTSTHSSLPSSTCRWTSQTSDPVSQIYSDIPSPAYDDKKQYGEEKAALFSLHYHVTCNEQLILIGFNTLQGTSEPPSRLAK